jgi:hypothetical protein
MATTKKKLKPAKDRVKMVYGYVPAQYHKEANERVKAICNEYKIKVLQP